MDKVQFALVIHNHQPVGNFDAVFREVTERAYIPFLRVASRFPSVRFGLHTSGCLLEWMEQHGGEYLDLVRQLVHSGQVELLGGGMYEPILPVLPRRDALWQLERMNEYVEQLFGAAPRGMWCPERVWEPHLPEVISAAGLEYTLLDDFHFRSAADAQEVETQYFRTSHAGHTVNLLPISQKLRYTMPFQPVDRTMDYLRSLAGSTGGTPLAVFGDDGEKFGNWPDTYNWVYEQGWLEDFFAALAGSGEWLEVLAPAEVIDSRAPAGDVFLPALSYAEMGEWTRLDPDAGPNDPPGHWRNYLRKYPESKQLLDRTVHLSNMLASDAGKKLPTDLRASTEEHLGKAQCNCAYWHGVFGGIYLNYLRHALHQHAITAESKLHEVTAGDGSVVQPYPAGTKFTNQYLLADSRLATVVDTGHGLCLTRLDDRDTAFCWTNVLTRRREQYHRKLEAQQADDAGEHASIHDRVVIKQDGLTDLLTFDDHQRVSFNVRGHTALPPGEASPEEALQVLQSGVAFDDWQAAATEVATGADSVSARIALPGISGKKSAKISAGGLELDCVISARERELSLSALSVEFNLTMLTDNAPDRWIEAGGERLPLDRPAAVSDCDAIALCDGWQGRRLRVVSSGVHAIFTYPVYTASSSEGGFERTYQGSCIVFLYMHDGTDQSVKLRLVFEEMTDEH